MTLPLFDSHCHLDDPRIDLTAARRAMDDAGVVGAVIAGYGPERHERGRLACVEDARLKRAVGLHPWWLASQKDRELGVSAAWEAVVEEAARAGVVAIGEIGLDRGRKHLATASEQRRWMQHGLNVANELELPVILHVVGWTGHAIEELRACTPVAGGVVHRFGGSHETIEPLVALGCMLSIDTIAFRRDPDRARARAAAIPLDMLVVETDWPEPGRDYAEALGELERMLEILAADRGVGALERAEITASNARRLYRWV